MTDISIANTHRWHFGSYLGLSHPFFTLNVHIILHTIVLLFILLFAAIFIRVNLKRSNLIAYIVCDLGFSLVHMLEQAIGVVSPRHFYFIGSLFITIAWFNLAPLIPGLEEPTQDINTGFALGLVSFFYIQYSAISVHGLWSYIKEEFLSPLFLLPLHIVGKLASILSISLRLFGNVFGGSIITKIYFSAIQFSFSTNFLGILFHLMMTGAMTIAITMFFIVIEGLLQAFVFTTLTVTYLGIAIRQEPGN